MRAWLSRLGDLLFRRSREERIDTEIDHHLQMLADAMEAAGLSRREALMAARRQFGNVDGARMAVRDQRGFAGLDALMQDVRFAFRILTRERGFALTAIVVLGVGLGVNNLFFTLVYAHKFRAVPIVEPDRVLSISTLTDRTQRAVSLAEFQKMRDALTTFEALVAYASTPVTVGDADRAPDRVDGAYVSAGAFELLRIPPLMGNLPSAADDRAGAGPLVMLGAGLWRGRYGADRSIIGRTIYLNGSPVTVVAVMPDHAGFPSTAGVWMPLGQWPGIGRDSAAPALQVFGRLRDGVTSDDARVEVETLFGRLGSRPDQNVRARVIPLHAQMFGTLDGWEPFIIAGVIVLLVACANVANLMMAQSMHRATEIAIRTSLGASRWRIVRQLLVEAAVIAAAGGLAGALFARGGVALFTSALPDGVLPYWIHYRVDARVFAGLILITTACVVIFGLVPSWQASRTDVNRTLKDGGRASTAQTRSGRLTAGFLAVELALAMIMLTQVAIATLRANAGLPTDDVIHTTAVITSAVTLPATAYSAGEQRDEFFRRLFERLGGRAEISAASRASLLPGEGGGAGMRRVDVEGRAAAEGQQAREYQIVDIAPDYFKVLALPPVKGREFDEADGTSGNDTAIVSARFAETALEGLEPLGARIAISAPDAPPGAAAQWRTIIGVTPTIAHRGSPPPGVVYLPIAASRQATSVLMVRHSLASEAAARLLRDEVRAVDPDVPLYRMRTLARAIDDANWNGRVSAYLASTVSLLTLLLAIVGLYAVTAQRVMLKTHEIGVCMALGAESAQIVGMVLRGLRVPLVMGLLLGTMGAVAWTRAFSSGDRDVYAAVPETVMTIGALLVAIMTVSCVIPIRRAVRMNPVTALRHD